MRQTTGNCKSPGEKIVKDIKRATRKHCPSEEKSRIVLGGRVAKSVLRTFDNGQAQSFAIYRNA